VQLRIPITEDQAFDASIRGIESSLTSDLFTGYGDLLGGSASRRTAAHVPADSGRRCAWSFERVGSAVSAGPEPFNAL
jgi:hypothetical protein